MKKLLTFLMLFSLLALCARDVYRNSSGRISSTTTQSGNRTVYRDGSGRIQGTSTQSGNRTVYRDGSGRIQGTRQSR